MFSPLLRQYPRYTGNRRHYENPIWEKVITNAPASAPPLTHNRSPNTQNTQNTQNTHTHCKNSNTKHIKYKD